MSKTIPDHTLVVVADGGKAKFFRAKSDGGAVHLTEERSESSGGFEAETPSGSRPADQSPEQTAKAGFANHLAHTLQTQHQKKRFEHLVLVADPTTLGELRAALHGAVEKSVVRSVSKDLTNHPTKAIEDALSD